MFPSCDNCGGFGPFTEEIAGKGRREEVQLCAYCRADIREGQIEGVRLCQD